MNLGCINVQSLIRKSVIIQNLIVECKLDVLAITETWHVGLDSVSLRCTAPVGFKCVDVPRPIRPSANVDSINFVNHGGVAIICRKFFSPQQRLTDMKMKTFELVGCMITSQCTQCFVVVICRPGSSAFLNYFSTSLPRF